MFPSLPELTCPHLSGVRTGQSSHIGTQRCPYAAAVSSVRCQRREVGHQLGTCSHQGVSPGQPSHRWGVTAGPRICRCVGNFMSLKFKTLTEMFLPRTDGRKHPECSHGWPSPCPGLGAALRHPRGKRPEELVLIF